MTSFRIRQPLIHGPAHPVRRSVLAITLAFSLMVPVAVLADQPGAVPCGGSTGCFGMSFSGSPFSPALQPPHDQSSNAKDNIVPRTMVINQGQSVTYEVNGVHWPAVYQVGIDDEDISTATSPAPGCPTGQRLNDATGRVFQTANCLPNGATFTVPASTFTTPGRYLIICQVPPHFAQEMYGWILVR